MPYCIYLRKSRADAEAQKKNGISAVPRMYYSVSAFFVGL